MRYALVKTAWGTFGFVARGERIVATFLPRSASQIQRAIDQSWPDAVEARDQFPGFCRQVRDYFAGRVTQFEVEVDLSHVSPYHRMVLEACRRIPYGRTASYADLARATGKPGAARAVGGAMAHNPLPLVIPCHRVLRSDGSLGGFSSPDGIKEKQRLLRLESATTADARAANGPCRPSPSARGDGVRTSRRRQRERAVV